jgi:large subunit ribosomal protein L5
MNRLEEHYKTTLMKELIETFEYKNLSHLPSLDKIIVNCGLKSVNFNAKLIYPVILAIEGLTGQRPKVTRSSKDNANLKIRSGMISGAKVTLRGSTMFRFIDELILTILPRIDYFGGFTQKSLTENGNFNLRIRNPQDSLFVDTEFEKFQSLGPIDVTIVFKNTTPEESLFLLTGLQIPIIVSMENEESEDTE